MSARRMDADSLAARSRHAPALLGSSAGWGLRVLALVLAAAFAALGVAAAATIDKPERASVTLLLCGLAVAALWGIWFSRLALLHAESDQARMPGVAPAIGGTLAVLALATVVGPGLALGALGIGPGLAICALALAAGAGLVVATLPRIIYLMLCFAPMLIGLLHALLERLVPAGRLDIGWQPTLDHVAWAVLPVLGLAGWRWFAVVRQSGQPGSPWWQPAITATPHKGIAHGWFAGGAGSADLPDWMWPSGQTAGAGPDAPVRAMRALLGTPFAPLSGGQILVQAGIAIVAFGYLALAATRDDGDVSTLVGGVIGGAAVLVVMYGQRLDAMYRKRAAELDELALLPGLGDATVRRRHLLAAVSWSPGWAMVLVFGVLVAMAVAAGVAPNRLGIMLLASGGIVLLTALACLRPMAGLRLDGLRIVLMMGPGLLLAMGTILYAALADGAGRVPAILAAVWLVAYALLGSALYRTWIQFRARPHPFLQD